MTTYISNYNVRATYTIIPLKIRILSRLPSLVYKPMSIPRKHVVNVFKYLATPGN